MMMSEPSPEDFDLNEKKKMKEIEYDYDDDDNESKIELSYLMSQIIDLRLENNQLREEMADYERLKQDYAQLTKRYARLNAQTHEIVKGNKKLNEQATEINELVSILTRNLDESQIRMAILTDEKAALERELASMKSHQREHDFGNEQLAKLNEDLMERLNEIECKCKCMQDENESLLSRLDDLYKTCDSKRQQTNNSHHMKNKEEEEEEEEKNVDKEENADYLESNNSHLTLSMNHSDSQYDSSIHSRDLVDTHKHFNFQNEQQVVMFYEKLGALVTKINEFKNENQTICHKLSSIRIAI